MGCGSAGVLVSRHTTYHEEAWVQTNRAYIEATSQGAEQFLSIKGSYLSDRNGVYTWLLSRPGSSFTFYLDEASVSFSAWGTESGQAINGYSFYMFNGYRYSFYVTTTNSYSSGFLWLAFYDPKISIRENFGSVNCEACNVSGCVDRQSLRDSCPYVNTRPTPSPLRSRSPTATPIPVQTPTDCGNPGLLVSRHSVFGNENWIQTNRAYVEVDESLGLSQYFSMKGSYISDRTGTYWWLYSIPEDYVEFYIDDYSYGFSSWDEESDQVVLYRSLYMHGGYRYSFYVTTYDYFSSGFMWLALHDPVFSTREYFGSENCEMCNASGCADMRYERDSGCPAVSLRPTVPIWETRSPSPSATPKATPVGCGRPGVYVSRHTSYGAENWVETDHAFVEVDESQNAYQYLSIKGSYLSDRTGFFYWLFSQPYYSYYYSEYSFIVDGGEYWNSMSYYGQEDDQYITSVWLYMVSGYRYSFYVRTTGSYSSAFLWLALLDYYGYLNYGYDREYFGSENCEMCNASGCVDITYNSDLGCPDVSLRPTVPLWATRSPSPTATPVATPFGCGRPGVYVSRHTIYGEENWVETNRAFIEVDEFLSEDQFLSIKGSYLSDRTGVFYWLFSQPYYAYYDSEYSFIVDGYEYWSYMSSYGQEDDQYITFVSLYMVSGYRYSFDVRTTGSYSSAFLWLALLDEAESGREYFGSENCELCNASGCADLAYERDNCPEISVRATAHPWETRSPAPSPPPSRTPRATRSYSKSRSPTGSRSPSSTPLPSPSDWPCGEGGILVSSHNIYMRENWGYTSRAFVEVDPIKNEYQYLSMKGSYLSDRNGYFYW
jgi:hypothetical protein